MELDIELLRNYKYIPVYCFAIMSANRCCIYPDDSFLSMLQVQSVKIVVNSGKIME